MAYIGRDIEYGTLTKQTLTANSSTTVFALDQSVFDANSLLVSVGGVIQEPDEAYTASGTTLTFSEAPTTGDPIWIVYLGKNLGTSTTRGAITYQAATGDGSATAVAMTSSGNTGNIVVTLNGVAQTPSTDFSVSGSTLTFTTAPFNGAAIGIHYLGKQARLGVPSSGSIVQADLANSGTLPAWDASALTGITGMTKADVFELQNNIALLNFLRANDITAKRASMLNGFQDQFRTEDGIVSYNGSVTITPSSASDFSGSPSSFSYGSGSVTATTNNKAMYSTATLSGDFEVEATITGGESAAGWFGVFDSAEVGTFNSSQENGNMGSFTDTWFISTQSRDSKTEGLCGGSNSSLAAYTCNNNDIHKFKRVGSTLTVYQNGTLKHTATNIITGTMHVLFGAGGGGSSPYASYASISWITNQQTTNTGSSDLTYSSNSYTNGSELSQVSGRELRATHQNMASNSYKRAGIVFNAGSNGTTVEKIKWFFNDSTTSGGNANLTTYISPLASGSIAGGDAVPSTTILATSDNQTLPQGSGGWDHSGLLTFTFSSPVQLTPNTEYAIYVGYEGTNTIGIALDSGSGFGYVQRNVSGTWSFDSTLNPIYYMYTYNNLEIMTKGTNDLSEVSSPSSAPSKGHIEAFIDDKMSGEETITSSASEWSGNGTSHVTFSGNDIKVNTGDKQIYVPTAITGNFEVTGTWYGSTGQNSTGQNVNRGFALGFFATGETYTDALDTDNMTQIWYYDAPNQGSGAGDSFGYGQASQGTFTPTNGDTFKFCRIGGTFYWYFADVLRHTWSQTYTGTGHIILNWSGVTNIEIKNLQWVTSQGTSATYPTVNTDIVGEMSRDGGTTWSPATLRRVEKVIAGSDYNVVMGDIDFTGDPSGTNIKGRIKTVNKHKVTVKGMAVNWQ